MENRINLFFGIYYYDSKIIHVSWDENYPEYFTFLTLDMWICLVKIFKSQFFQTKIICKEIENLEEKDQIYFYQ